MSAASGRFVLRIPPSLHARARACAGRWGLSLNEYCRRAVEHYTETDGAVAASGSEEVWIGEARRVLGADLSAVILFGSTARGESRASSDVDLLVVTGAAIERGLYESWDRITTTSLASPHFVHLPSSAAEAGSVWFEVALDGIVLYEDGRRVSRFLGELRRSIAEGGVERRTAYGHGYWVRRDREAAHVQR